MFFWMVRAKSLRKIKAQLAALQTTLTTLESTMSELGTRLDEAVTTLMTKIDEAQARVESKIAEEDAAQAALAADVLAKQAEIDRLAAIIAVLEANPSSDEVAALTEKLQAAIADLESTLPPA